MELITGGAFQGKLDYAKKKYGFRAKDICECTEDALPDFTAPCLDHFEKYLRYCLREGLAPVTSFKRADTYADAGAPKVIIMDDIFCGVVPADPEIRAWRELCGRSLTALAAGADEVTRLFCGIPKRIK